MSAPQLKCFPSTLLPCWCQIKMIDPHFMCFPSIYMPCWGRVRAEQGASSAVMRHLCGMQCPKTRWRACEACQRQLREADLEDEYALQSWFVGRINTFLRSKGRQLIGWDEILEGGLSPGAMVMSWRVCGGTQCSLSKSSPGHSVLVLRRLWLHGPDKPLSVFLPPLSQITPYRSSY
jgi:hypothetical protein